MHGAKDASLAKVSFGQGELGIDEWCQWWEMRLVLDGWIDWMDFVPCERYLWTKLMMMDRACVVPLHEWVDPPSHCWHRPASSAGDDGHGTTWAMW